MEALLPDRGERNKLNTIFEQRVIKNTWMTNSKPNLKIKKLKRPTTSKCASKPNLTLNKNRSSSKRLLIPHNPYMKGTMPVNLVGVYNTAVAKNQEFKRIITNYSRKGLTNFNQGHMLKRNISKTK